MTLGRKTFLWMSVTLAVLLPVSLFISSRIVGVSFSRVESASVRENVERLRQIVASEGEALAVMASDWAAWDDTYNYFADTNAAYATANLTDASIGNLRVDVMLFIDNAGVTVFGTGFDIVKGEHTELPRGLADYVKRPGSKLTGLKATDAVHGLLQLPEGTMLLAAHPVLRSERTGEPRGSVIYGRWLNEPMISRMEKILRYPLAFERVDDRRMAEDFKIAHKELLAGAAMFQRVAGNDDIAGYAILPDLHDKPALIARVDLPRTIYDEGQLSLLNLALWMLGSALAFGAVMLLLMRTLVLQRISKLMEGVGRIRSTSDLTARLKTAGDDEIAEMTNAINLMLESLEKSELLKKKSDAELAMEKERLSVTLRSIGEGVIATDTAGRVVLMNKVAESLTGWFSNEAAGQLMWKIFHAVDARAGQPLRDAFEQVAGGRGACALPAATLLVSRNGTELGVEGNVAPVEDQRGKIVGTVLVFRDTTDARRLEEERLRANKLESVGLLAGGIAHDFNNALMSILSNNALAQLCSHGDAELRGYLVDTEKACLRARSLTQQLLTFSRGGAPVKKVADLGELVREVGGFAVRGSNVLCHFKIAENLWPAEVDEGQIVQVVQNLVINAVQAMPDGGNIRIVATNLPDDAQPDPLPPGKYVAIEVHDEGPGIPADQLPRVFDPYFTTKRNGTGLGLATAYSIVRNHGGHIMASSAPDHGATFCVYLPASPAATVRVESGRPEDWRGHGRLLLMDDEELTLRALSTLLRKLGFEVATTLDGQATIDAYVRAIDERRPFDAVIMDLTVPGGMGGREAAAHLLALHPPARLIVSSGYSNDPVMSEFEKHGFCAVLAKPYSTGDLVAVLRKILGDRSAAQPAP